jgi:tetratricopeptide (TPR) repeat protein
MVVGSSDRWPGHSPSVAHHTIAPIDIFWLSGNLPRETGSNNQLAPTGNQKMPDNQPLSEVVIPPPKPVQPAAEKPRKKARKRSKKTAGQRRWERVKSLGKIAVAIFAGIPSVIIAAWILVSLIVLIFHRHSIDLDAIGVPETLSKAGFTSEVATQHLRDAIYAVQERSQTTMAKTGVDTDQDLSGITIPKTGLSLQSVAVAVRSLLPGWRHEVSGEFVQSVNGILLRLRLNGKVIFSQTGIDTDPSTADALLGKDLAGGAFNVVEETQPYVAAAALYGAGKGDLAAADTEADHIIAFGAADTNVLSGVTLKGLTGDAHSYDAQADAFESSALYIDGMIGYLTSADEDADGMSVLLTTDENVLRAVNLKGLIAAAQGDYPRAIALFKKIPWFAVARSNLANVYLDQHQLELAISLYQTAIWLDPKSALPHNGLGIVYYDQHKLDDAIAEYKTAIQLDPKYALPHLNLGKEYYDQHKLDDAIAEYKTAIQLDSKFAMPHLNLGNVYYDQHKFDDAITEYKTAIQLDPKSALPHSNLGVVYYDQHKLDDAIAEYKTAIQLDPNNAPAHSNLGNLYYDQHKLDDAIAEHKTAIQLDPKSALPHNNLGKVYYDQHKLDDAITEFKTAIQLDPKYALPHNDLGYVYLNQHKLDDAIAEYKTAIQLDPKYALPHLNLGNVYYDQHKLDDAIAEYKTAIQLDPNGAASHYNLGNVYGDQQRLDDACRAYAEGSKLAPDNPNFPARMHEIDSQMQGHRHCPPV